jgi:N-acetylneuraminic acid mutarotase
MNKSNYIHDSTVYQFNKEINCKTSNGQKVTLDKFMLFTVGRKLTSSNTKTYIKLLDPIKLGSRNYSLVIVSNNNLKKKSIPDIKLKKIHGLPLGLVTDFLTANNLKSLNFSGKTLKELFFESLEAILGPKLEKIYSWVNESLLFSNFVKKNMNELFDFDKNKSITKLLKLSDIYEDLTRDKVLIMGGIDSDGRPTNIVTKMIINSEGDIIFEDGKPMSQPRDRENYDAVYYKGEVLFSPFSQNSTPSKIIYFDTLTNKHSEISEELLNKMPQKSQADGFYNSSTLSVLDNKIFIISGYWNSHYGFITIDKVYELEEFNDTWNIKSKADLNECSYNSASIEFDKKIFVCGGNDGSLSGVNTNVMYFDPETNIWNKDSDMVRKRESFSLFVYNEELYAVGGDYEGGCTIEKRRKDYNTNSNNEEYINTLNGLNSEENGPWMVIAACNRNGCASALIGSKIFLFGGGNNKSTFDYIDLAVEKKKWASQDDNCKYFNKKSRVMPREINNSIAVFIPGSLLNKRNK